MVFDPAQLRGLRQARGWDVPDMARELRRAAGGGPLPAQASLVRMIRRWEAGETDMSERYQLLFRKTLSGPPPGDAAATDGTADSIGVRARDGGEDVQRREFLAASAALAGAAAMPPQVACLTAGRWVGADMPALLRQRLARLRRLDNYLGGSETYRLYADELEATKTLAREAACSQATRQVLLAIISEQAQQAGWAAFDAGWQATATAHYTDSRHAAREAGDRPLEANAFALLAYQALTTRKPALTLAQASCDAIGTAAPQRAIALLHERRAWTLASTSAQASDVSRALATAADALARDDETTAPDWAAWADETELAIITGRCHTALGQPKKAIPVLRTALATFDDAQARDKALYLTWLAEAHHDVGEADEAAAIASQSLTLSAGVGSVRPAQRLRVLVRRLTERSDSPQVSALREQAASLTPAPWPG
jgi:hypothetical protein